MSDSDANSGCCFLSPLDTNGTWKFREARGKRSRRRRRAGSRQTLRQLAHAMEVHITFGTGWSMRRVVEAFSHRRAENLTLILVHGTAKPSRHAPQNSFDTAPLRYPRLPTRLPSTSRSRAATRVAGSQPVQSSGQIQKCARIPRNRSLCSSRNAWSTVCLGSCTFHACAMTVYASNVK